MAEASEPRRDNVGRAGVLLASGTIVSRILGFVGAILLARTLGTVGSGADAFALANQLPNNIYALVAGGILTAILVLVLWLTVVLIPLAWGMAAALALVALVVPAIGAIQALSGSLSVYPFVGGMATGR